MNTVELDHALRKLRLSGIADMLETRLRQAQSEKMAPIDFLSVLVSDELLRRQDRLFDRRTKHARFRDPNRTLDSFDFNRKMNRALLYDLATAPSRGIGGPGLPLQRRRTRRHRAPAQPAAGPQRLYRHLPGRVDHPVGHSTGRAGLCPVSAADHARGVGMAVFRLCIELPPCNAAGPVLV